jgi:dienelactone hydrolase
MRSRLRPTLVLMCLVPTLASAATATLCARLGDRVFDRVDSDTFTLSGAGGETLHVVLSARPDAAAHGSLARLTASHGPGGARRAQGPLPLALDAALPRGGTIEIRVRALRGAPDAFVGPYCLTVTSSGAASESLARTADVEMEWVALAADRGSVFPPFVPVASGDWAGLVQPLFPLDGARVYGVVVTNRVHDHDGHALEAAPAFARAAGVHRRSRGGIVAEFDDDPDAAGNPYPEARLVRADGTIHVPDRIAWKGLDPANAALDGARADLRASADQLETLDGFSPIQPIEIALSGAADIATVTPASVLVFERTDGKLDTKGLLAAALKHGVRRRDVALAISFPTQDIEHGLRTVRERLDAIAASSPLGAILVDPDPNDDLPIGVFGPGSPEFGTYLAANPVVGKVVTGFLPSREFRAANGLFDPAVLAGSTPPRRVLLDFVLTIPADVDPPYPVAIFQHGFGGSNQQVLSRVGAVLAQRGIATIGISAASHGRRGSPIDLLTGSALQLRDIFRQTNADQMALVRMLEAGVDIDADGTPDLDASRISYIGISLGGLVGGPFVAVEPNVHAAVLNVMGGRTALNALNEGTKPIFASYLASRVGLAVDSPEFDAYLAREVDLGQHGANEADSLNFARRWIHQPFPGYERRRVLMQEGIGDQLVFNALSEELAMVAGLESNVEMSDPAGVSGHWIFDPPGGHGIFDDRPDVRAQAAQYLKSGGIALIEPPVP